MIVVPIKFKETLLGVLQLINRQNGGSFTDQEYEHSVDIAKVMGQKFRYDLKTTLGPYDLLIQDEKVTLEQIEEYEEKATADNLTVSHLLAKEGGVPLKISAHRWNSITRFHL